jgi:spermidine/putrescine transport system permease protein
MIPSLPRPAWLRAATGIYVGAFLLLLFLPLRVVAVFALNDAPTRRPGRSSSTGSWATRLRSPRVFATRTAGQHRLYHRCHLRDCPVAGWAPNAFLMESLFEGGTAVPAPPHDPGVILASILAAAGRGRRATRSASRLTSCALEHAGAGPVLSTSSRSQPTISARLKRFDRTSRMRRRTWRLARGGAADVTLRYRRR